MEQFPIGKRYPYFMAGILVFLGLYMTSLYNYLLFHSLAEIFSIIVACGIFMVAWNSRHFLDNNYLLFLGIGYLFVSGLDLIHTLTYKGMGIFQGYGTNLATQLWIAARYTESLSLFIAPLFFRRKLKTNLPFLPYLLAFLVLLLSIFYWNIFPVCFVEGVGLTPFKKISEYLISVILLASIALLLKNRTEFDRDVFKWVVWSILLTITSELAFTLYIDAYGFFNLLGHFLKIVSFYLIYKALIEMGLTRPYDLLFKNLKRSEMRVREEKNKIQNYLDITGVILIVIDANQIVSLINKKGCQILGYEKKEILGKNWFDTFIPKGIRDEVRITFTSFMKGETNPVEYFENPVLTKSGEERMIAWHHAVLRDEKGNGISTLSSGEDITERKQMEEELRKSRGELELRVRERTAELANADKELKEQSRILESFFKYTVTPLVFLDRDFSFVRVNEAYAKSCQRNLSEFPGRNHFEFYPSDAKAKFEQVVQTKEPYVAIARPFTFPDHPEWGTTYWDWTLTPILDDAGEVEFLVFSLEDVTKRKRAEEQLKAAQQYNRSLIEVSLDPFVTINAEGKITDVNSATELATGVPREQLIGSDFSDYFTEPEKAREGYRTVFSKGTVRDYYLAIRHRSGMITDVLYNATLYRNKAGEIQGIFAAARDITEQKEAERRTNATHALLSLFSEKNARKEYLDGVVERIREWSGCRCVGIRVLDDRGYIPYESYVGFSQEFWERENWISVHKDSCACIRVVTGSPDPQDLSSMTPGGSFYCGNTSELLARLSEEEKERYRGTCVQNGFLSVYVIPISYHEKVLGGIHLADERNEQLPLKRFEFVEAMAPLMGEALNRFKLEEELRHSETRLRDLSSQLLTAQETERKRIAMELHDGIGQMLTAIKFKAESILQEKEKTKAKDKSLEAIISMIKETMEEVRRMQMDLHPSTLDDLGILATLGWFCREYQKIYSRIRIEKEIAIQESEVSTPLKVVIYRLTQETMNNIAKHSQADLIRLSLSMEKNRIELAIKDNGMGFDLEEVFSSGRSKRGLGLSSMRERTELSGGAFTIESTLGKGTTIRASWPV